MVSLSDAMVCTVLERLIVCKTTLQYPVAEGVLVELSVQTGQRNFKKENAFHPLRNGATQKRNESQRCFESSNAQPRALDFESRLSAINPSS